MGVQGQRGYIVVNGSKKIEVVSLPDFRTAGTISGLDQPRLVYSTNLSDSSADLRVLARLTNLTGNSGALAGFGSANFSIASTAVPEPSSWAMMLIGFGLLGAALRRRAVAARPTGDRSNFLKSCSLPI